MVMPAPGAVWPAIVMFGPVIRTLPRITPLTSKTTMRGPSCRQAHCSEPGPEGFRFVTLMTFPPRPPTATAPKPSAPGNAGRSGVSSAAETAAVRLSADSRHSSVRRFINHSLHAISWPLQRLRPLLFASSFSRKSANLSMWTAVRGWPTVSCRVSSWLPTSAVPRRAPRCWDRS